MKRLRVENINSEEYFDRQFEDKPVDMENTLRQDKYLEIIGKHDGINSVVELGCGMSAFLPKANETYANVFGLDFSSAAIDKLRVSYPAITWDVGDATHTDYEDGVFDAVVSGEVIEHLEEPLELVDEMARICRLGGVMVLSTPLLEFEDPEHVWQFEPEDLIRFFSPWGQPEVITLKSEKFPGREYYIVWVKKLRS